MLVREVSQDGQEHGWICGSCNTMFFDEELAQACCRPLKCPQCSKAMTVGRTLCGDCSDRVREGREDALFLSAAKVFFIDYEGRYLYWTAPGALVGEFFSSRTELEKFCEQRHIVPPRWCWATDEAGFLLDAERVLAGVVTRNNEDVRPLLTDHEVEQLQNVLDEWAMNLEVRSYDVDYDVAVILDRELYEAIRRSTP